MSTITEGNYITADAAADLSDKLNYIVVLDSSGNAALATGGTSEIAGVLSEVPQGATGSCSIAHVSGSGTGKVIAAGSITKDAYLTSDGAGKATTTTTTGHRVFGRARESASAGDIFEYEKMFYLHY